VRGVDELVTDEGTKKPELLMAEKKMDWARRVPLLSTYLLGPSESWVVEGRVKTQRLKAAWVPLQTQVMGCPEVGPVVTALEAAADADP